MTNNTIKNTPQKKSIIIPEFVNSILFSLVVGVGFFVFKDNVGFFLSFKLVMFITTYYIIIYDWVGYNNLIQEFPYADHIGRFILDIIIFFLFFLLFISITNFERYISILPFFFLIVPLWDQLALKQYKDKPEKDKEKLKKGRIIGLSSFLLFLTIAIAYRFSSIKNYEVTKWIIVLGTWITFTLLLRRFNIRL